MTCPVRAVRGSKDDPGRRRPPGQALTTLRPCRRRRRPMPACAPPRMQDKHGLAAPFSIQPASRRDPDCTPAAFAGRRPNEEETCHHVPRWFTVPGRPQAAAISRRRHQPGTRRSPGSSRTRPRYPHQCTSRSTATATTSAITRKPGKAERISPGPRPLAPARGGHSSSRRDGPGTGNHAPPSRVRALMMRNVRDEELRNLLTARCPATGHGRRSTSPSSSAGSPAGRRPERTLR